LYQHFFDTGKTGRLGAAGVSVAAVGERSDNPFDAKTVQLDQNFKTNGYWPVRVLRVLFERCTRVRICLNRPLLTYLFA
jgi:hypothetical protein